MADPTQFPATHTAHTPAGPVDCCERHAKQIVNLSALMGWHILTTQAATHAECVNCRNDAALLAKREARQSHG